jgi:signal transduction histidine kinase
MGTACKGAKVMPRLLRIAAWPLVVKVPVLVAGLMVTVAVAISQIVLWQFVEDQKSNLGLLTSAYLDGLSAAVLPAVMREDVWEAFDALDRTQSRYSGIEPRFTIIEMPGGKILASSDPLRFPVQSVIPDALHRRFPAEDGLLIDDKAGRAWLARTLRAQGFPVGRLFAEIDIGDLLRARRKILLTLVLVNGCLTLAFAFGGYFALTRMLRPFGVLTRYVEQIRESRVEPIPEGYRGRVAGEFGQLFDRFNAMAHALDERQTLAAQLADREKSAMLGRLASGIAHEVNNPLAGMLNAISTIQAHGENPAVLDASLEFLKRGLIGIRDVVEATLITYKEGFNTNHLTPSYLDDLRILVRHKTAARGLCLDWHNQIAEPLAIAGSAVRQITLNLLLNACAASPISGLVTFTASYRNGSLRIAVADEGPGLPAEMAALLERAAPTAAPSAESKGLGLWMTGHLIQRLGGHADIEYPGVGTRIVVTLPAQSKNEALDAAA